MLQIEPATLSDAGRPDLVLAANGCQATALQRSGAVLVGLVGPVAVGTSVFEPPEHFKLTRTERREARSHCRSGPHKCADRRNGSAGTAERRPRRSLTRLAQSIWQPTRMCRWPSAGESLRAVPKDFVGSAVVQDWKCGAAASDRPQLLPQRQCACVTGLACESVSLGGLHVWIYTPG